MRGFGFGMGFGSSAPVASDFSIDTLEGLTLDLNPESLSVGAVASFPDASSAGRDFAQSTAGNRPVIVAAAIGGKKALSFDRDAGHHLIGPSFSGLDATGSEVHVVLKADLSSGQPLGLWRFGSHASSAFLPFNDGIVYDGFGSTVRRAIDPDEINLALPHVYSAVSFAGQWRYLIDGVELDATGTNTPGFDAAGSMIGATSAGGTSPAFFWDGLMGRMVAFNRDLGSATRAQVIATLMTAYGIS